MERQSREHHLDPEVIFFVDHDGDVLVRRDRDPARSFGIFQLARDQLPLLEEQAVELAELVDVEEAQFRVDLVERPLDDRLDLRAFQTARPVDERESR